MRIDKKVDFGKKTVIIRHFVKKRERGDKKNYFIEHLIINPVLYVLNYIYKGIFLYKIKTK